MHPPLDRFCQPVGTTHLFSMRSQFELISSQIQFFTRIVSYADPTRKSNIESRCGRELENLPTPVLGSACNGPVQMNTIQYRTLKRESRAELMFIEENNGVATVGVLQNNVKFSSIIYSYGTRYQNPVIPFILSENEEAARLGRG